MVSASSCSQRHNSFSLANATEPARYTLQFSEPVGTSSFSPCSLKQVLVDCILSDDFSDLATSFIPACLPAGSATNAGNAGSNEDSISMPTEISKLVNLIS